MRNYLILILTILSFAGFSQGRPNNYTVLGSTAYDYTQPIAFSKGLGLPVGSTGPHFFPLQWQRAGAPYYDSVARILYIWNGIAWDTVGNVSGGTAGKIFAVSDTTATSNRKFDLNNYNLKFVNGTLRYGQSDTLGNVINYFLPTNPVDPSITVTGHAPTVNGTKMVNNGTAQITFPYYTGVENWSFEIDSIKTLGSGNAVQDITFAITPNSGPVFFTRKVTVKLADSARYLCYFKNSAATDPDYTTKGLSRIVVSTNDFLRFRGRFRQGKMLFELYVYSTGQTVELNLGEIGVTAGYFNIANVGKVSIEQVGNFEYYANIKYSVDEPKHAKLIAMGDSHTIGGGVPFVQDRFLNKLMQGYTDIYIAHDGSGETSAQAMLRKNEILALTDSGSLVMWNYSTNDPGNSITAVGNATNLRNFIDTMNVYFRKVVVGTPIPEATNMTVYRDSAVAIAIRYGLPYADLFNFLKDGNGGGTDKNPLWQFDPVHLGVQGNIAVAGLFNKIVSPYLHKKPSSIQDNVAVSSDIKDILARNYKNETVAFNFGSSDRFWRVVTTPNIPTAYQIGNYNGYGQHAFQGNGLIGQGDLLYTSTGNFGNPELHVYANMVRAPIFSSDDITIGVGTSMHFTTAAAYINTPFIYQQGAAVSLDTTNYKIVVQRSDNKTLYISPWPASGGGGGTFVGLSDGAGSFSGNALKGVRVNSGATALEYYTVGAPSFGDVTYTNSPTGGMSFTNSLSNPLSILRYGQYGHDRNMNDDWYFTNEQGGKTIHFRVNGGTEVMSLTGGALMAVATGVIIGNTTKDASAALEIQSTTQGLLPPKMTTTQMNAISSPATGLEIYNTTTTQKMYYSGSAWRSSTPITGSVSQVGTATTVFTVTFGGTQPNATYKVNVTPTAALSAALFYVTNKTTTTFDVTYLAGLTGTVTFDYSLSQ